MDEAEKGQTIKELEKLIREFRSYKRLEEISPLSKNQEGYMRSLQYTLQRKIGTYKEFVVRLTGKRYAQELNYKFDFWDEALRSGGLKSLTLQSIEYCIQSINEAIGKLEDDIKKGLRDKQGNLIEKPQRIATEPPKAFIAHGGESPALGKLKNFLEALGVQPLIVEEQPSEGRSITENVDYYARQSDFAIILATKGDVDGKTGGFIPRGNVLMEIGKLQELLKDRIVYLLQAGTKLPTNISDKVRERFTSQSMDNAFIKVAKELRRFGIIKAI